MDTVDVSRVIGAVIGLARAAEGNENRPGQLACDALLGGMYAALPGTGLSGSHVGQVIQRLHQEKEKLTPRCGTCEEDCERNEDFNLFELAELEPELLAVKDSLLSGLLSLEPLLRGQKEAGPYRSAVEFLFKGFFYVGKECEKEELEPLFDQLCEVQRSLCEVCFA